MLRLYILQFLCEVGRNQLPEIWQDIPWVFYTLLQHHFLSMHSPHATCGYSDTEEVKGLCMITEATGML